MWTSNVQRVGGFTERIEQFFGPRVPVEICVQFVGKILEACTPLVTINGFDAGGEWFGSRGTLMANYNAVPEPGAAVVSCVGCLVPMTKLLPKSLPKSRVSTTKTLGKTDFMVLPRATTSE